MTSGSMEKRRFPIEKIITRFVFLFIFATFLIIAYSFIDKDIHAEAPTGEFVSGSFNEDWLVKHDGIVEKVTLPVTVKVGAPRELVLNNTLPDDIIDGMHLFTRTSLEDIFVYVDGELRSSYYSEGFSYMSYYLPSEYVVTEINREDAGKPIEILLKVKDKGVVNEMTICQGNDSWYYIFRKNIVLAVIALFSVVLGFAVAFFYVILRRRISINSSILYMGLIMVMMGTWILSESKIRQFIFTRPSLSMYFSYFSLEIVGVLVCLYMDNAQYLQYHKRYMVVAALMSSQIVINVLLCVLFRIDLYRTLIFSHVWIVLGMAVAIYNLVTDMLARRSRKYAAISVGLGCFLISCLAEFINFYFNKFYSIGSYLYIGLIILLFATVIQIVLEETRKQKEREERREENVIKTIETIASAIDAKDEYTGGHSERVAEYAYILSKEIAPMYNLTPDDILQIRYVALMHDIGKIGVADTILNKSGKLTDEEFSLMKKHVEIGHALLKDMGKDMDGLLDGVRYHHERYDGTGYPDGLKGEEIPLIARVLCLADCYDAMTSNRVYRTRLSNAEVRNEIEACAGKQFDPVLAKVFLGILDRGDIKPSTKRGMDTNVKGQVLKSAQLEELLRVETSLPDCRILNPSNVRMVSYIIKLSEKSMRLFDVFFVEVKCDEPTEEIRKERAALLRQYSRRGDIFVEYTSNTSIWVLFEREPKDIVDIVNSLESTIIDGYSVTVSSLDEVCK